MSERAREPRWLWLYEQWQAETNILASVAIEVPALRPVLEARIRAMDGPAASPSSDGGTRDE
jgi:hypothetical protein